MKVHVLAGVPAPALATALAAFEARFTYPLGESTRFSISHGDDYACFFRAMGESFVGVAEHRGEVLGTIGGAVRTLVHADGRAVESLYVGDLKVLPGLDAGRILLRLAGALKSWAEPRVSAAFGVVMGGTGKTPERYTGRFGLPAFAKLGKVLVLRLSCGGPAVPDVLECARSDGLERFRSLTRGRVAVGVGQAELRSALMPRWLKLRDGGACGMLEDTRKAKRLFQADGAELMSGHLSAFAFASAGSGAALLRGAASLAGALGFPALFCAVPEKDAAALVQALGASAPTQAVATVYGAGLPAGAAWHVNTSEI